MMTLVLATVTLTVALTAPPPPRIERVAASVSATIIRAHIFGKQEADATRKAPRTIKRHAADGTITILVE